MLFQIGQRVNAMCPSVTYKANSGTERLAEGRTDHVSVSAVVGFI